MSLRRGPVKQNKCMEFIHDRDSFTLRQYCEVYKHALPAFIIVTQGFYGDCELEIMGNGQILRINSCVYQKRAVATDTHKRTLSVPLNYPLKFRVLDSKNRPSKDEDSLSNIIAKRQLPLKIQLSDSKDITFSMNAGGIGSPNGTDSLGPLVVTEVYEETYFLSNAICHTDGSMEMTATLIPLYLGDIRVAPITGVEGMTREEWQEYNLQKKTECKRVQIPLDTGLREIAIFSANSIKDSENIYEYIEPSSYIVSNWAGKAKTDANYATNKSLKPPPLKPKPKPQTKAPSDGPPPAVPARQANTLSKAPSSLDNPYPPYANTAVGRATVAPFSQIAKDAAKMATGSELKKESVVTEPTRDEVAPKMGDRRGSLPSEKAVKELSIEELAAKMKELKLEKYLKTFKDQGVDGELAAELDETILRDEFKFSKFESLKFLKFIKTGHVPR